VIFLKLDFSAKQWEFYIDNCSFTDKELAVIQLKRRGWRIIDIGEEMKSSIGYEVSERTISRWCKNIKKKIQQVE
jgi:DNA-binding NarL/FixJ family response regulator